MREHARGRLIPYGRQMETPMDFGTESPAEKEPEYAPK